MTQYWDFLDTAADALGLGGVFQDALNIASLFGLGGGFCLLRLGNFSFSVSSAAHQQLSRSREYRWEKVDRLGRAPARQFMGVGDDTIQLQGVMFPEFAGGGYAVDKLCAQAGSGEPFLLLDHFGSVLGEFCILTVADVHEELDMWGVARKINFSLSLGAYGEDYQSQLEMVDVAGVIGGLF